MSPSMNDSTVSPSSIYVYGGVLWRSDDLKDDFLTSHGIHTPTDYWKILVYQGQVLAWIVPNSQDAKRSVLDNYVVNPNNLLDTLSSINVRIDDLDKQNIEKCVPTSNTERKQALCEKKNTNIHKTLENGILTI